MNLIRGQDCKSLIGPPQPSISPPLFPGFNRGGSLGRVAKMWSIRSWIVLASSDAASPRPMPGVQRWRGSTDEAPPPHGPCSGAAVKSMGSIRDSGASSRWTAPKLSNHLVVRSGLAFIRIATSPISPATDRQLRPAASSWNPIPCSTRQHPTMHAKHPSRSFMTMRSSRREK